MKEDMWLWILNAFLVGVLLTLVWLHPANDCTEEEYYGYTPWRSGDKVCVHMDYIHSGNDGGQP